MAAIGGASDVVALRAMRQAEQRIEVNRWLSKEHGFDWHG